VLRAPRFLLLHHRSVALLEFLAAAAWAGIVASHPGIGVRGKCGLGNPRRGTLSGRRRGFPARDEAIRRGRAYADAGVDLVWPELSSPDREPAVAFAKALRESHPGLPLAFNYSSSFKWHKDANPFTFKELGELGYKFIFITLFAAHAGMYAVWNAMEELVKDQEQAQWRLEKTKDGHPTESHHVMARVSHFQELEKKYIPGSDARIKSSAGFDDKRMH